MNTISVMKEYQASKFTKLFSWLTLAVLAIGALLNIHYGNVTHPKAFLVVLVGFILFAIGKLSVIRKKQKISFGAKLMTENMASLYRIGYWLMIVGLLATFAP